MRAVERRLDILAQSSGVPVHRIQRHGDLEHLLAVSHVGRAVDDDLPAEPAEALAAFPLHLVEGGPQRGGVDSAIVGMGALALAAHHLHPQIGVQHPPGGQHRSLQRHHDLGNAELRGHRRYVQPGRAAEGQQREPARIDPAAHRGDAHAVRHAGVDQPDDARRRRRRFDPQPAGKLRDHPRRRRLVQ